jgi:molecular chaperone DnaK
MANDKKSIGRFMLDGVLPSPRGTPQIEVTFDIDANGILSVSAHDKGTGKEQKIVIQSGSGLAKEEIERMVNESMAHAEQDQVRRAEVETRNQADSLVYGAEKMIEENKEKVPQELKEEVEGKIAILKTAVAENNVAEMQAAIKELNDSLQKVGQAVYSEASEPAETTEETPPGDDEPGADTVEGEFREV